MKPVFFCFHVILSSLPWALGDFLGPSWLPPRDLSSPESFVALAFSNLSATLAEYVNADASGQTENLPEGFYLDGLSNLTISLGVYSLHDPEAEVNLQYHYTAPEIAVEAPNGTHAVNADSIYRVASVTKVLTVLAGLLNLEDADWDRSLADILPALTAYAEAHPSTDDPTSTIAWQDVTLRALAAQIGGVTREGFPSLNELALSALAGTADTASMGLPPINATDPLFHPACLDYLATPTGACPSVAYLESVANRPPTFAPWTTPGYANNGFVLLGIALANLTNQTYESLVQTSIFDPLGMTSSFTTTPPLDVWDRSVIPGIPTSSFDFPSGVFVSSGGASSSINDLAKLGKGILNGTLLSPAAMRRWMKPVTHTARLQYSVGAPWEIHRYTLSNSKVVDLYTKLGDSGAYSAFFILLPDYGLGINLLSASATLTARFSVLASVADIVVNTLIPAFDAQAAREASRALAGTYTDPSQQASLTLVVNQTSVLDGPGLVVESWTSNGTDVLTSDFAKYIGTFPWRLVPSVSDAAHGKQAFRLVPDMDAPARQAYVGSALFSGIGFKGGDWLYLDAVTYGGIGAALFVFDVDENGRAGTVSPASFRQTLRRT